MNFNVKVKLKSKTDSSYDIVIENNLSANLAQRIVKDNFGKKYCIVTDSKVEKQIGKKLLAQFNKIGAKAHLVSFPAGEKNKNLASVQKILEKMSSTEFDRKDCIIALGGGVAGDVAGFCAAIYQRGVNFVQVPTTLLAMVDSSIGGKTGVNLKTGKNLVGSFCQPKRVYICPEFLNSLPKIELINGMSEVVKHAIVMDKGFFEFLEQNSTRIISLDSNTIPYVIARNCQIKAGVVEKDEKEQNYRKVVNYGHTIGHALEALGNYKTLSHGQAISIGMVVEANISRRMGLMEEYEAKRIINMLHKIGLPVKLPDFDLGRIIAATRKDKKTVSGTVYYSLPREIGKMHSQKGSFAIAVDDAMVRDALEDCR